MALIECVECRGTVSDAAASCPQCGHPEPVQGAEALSVPDRPQKAARPTVDNKRRPLWPVFLWAIGGFVVGVLVNGLVEAAGIALTDWSTDWNQVYRSSWFWSLLPYAVAAVGVFVGLARRHRGKPNPYKRLSLVGTAVILIGIGVVLSGANQQASGTEDRVAEAATTTTTTLSTTTTTGLGDRMLYCFEIYHHDGECDAEEWIQISGLVLEYYWDERWLPLWEEVAAASQNQDEARARITCELAKEERDTIEGRVVRWPQEDANRGLALDWLNEMEIQLEACAQGEWDVVSESRELNIAYLREMCSRLAWCNVPDDE